MLLEREAQPDYHVTCRSALTIAAPEGMARVDRPPTLGLAEGRYFKPDAGMLLRSPAHADQVPTREAQPAKLNLSLGKHGSKTLTHVPIRRPTRNWARRRSFIVDGNLMSGYSMQTSAGFGGASRFARRCLSTA